VCHTWVEVVQRKIVVWHTSFTHSVEIFKVPKEKEVCISKTPELL
jgi:hypothetical protein